MASIIKVTVTRDNSGRGGRKHSLRESFSSADTHPKPDVLKDCLRQVERKFEELHGEGSVNSSITVS